MNLDLSVIPFSRHGSYMAVSCREENFRGKGNRGGLYWRTVHDGSPTDLIARLVLLRDGEELRYTYRATESEITLTAEGAEVSLCFGDEDTLLMRGKGENFCLRLEGLSQNNRYSFVHRTCQNGKDHYVLNCFKNNARFLAYPGEGDIRVLQNWDGETSTECSIELVPQNGGFFCLLKDGYYNCECGRMEYDYEECRKRNEEELNAFCRQLPTVPEKYEPVRQLAAYINWSCMVKKFGALTRDGMLMSKNWMNLVWSWDHCFNAMALAYHAPEKAWDQFMLPFDYQDESGALPDTIGDVCKTTIFCKPPIHGWTLMQLMKRMEVSRQQLEEIYPKLEKWTDWWFTWRDSDNDGVCEYIHGNDSGWDNSTAFLHVPPTETPDLSAFLILQMDALSVVADKLGRTEEALLWKERADDTLRRMLEHSFPEGLPVVKSSMTHEVVENRSLIQYLPLLLGDRLPEQVRENMLGSLKEANLYTEHGFATEAVDSPYYRPDGYWRGPIWAPSTMLITEGLKNCGQKEWARETAERFCDMVLASGCAENYDALTGAGLRDRAYTWTASTFLVLAHEYLMP